MMARSTTSRSTTARTVPILLLAPLVTAVVSCSGDPSDEGYGDDNREAFVAACTDVGTDDRLVRDVCECTYDQLEVTLPYDRFAELEESLRLDALTPLPDEVTEQLADCFVAEADL